MINPETGEITADVPDLKLNGEPAALAMLFGKMAKVLGNIARVPKTGENTHFRYKYATEGDLMDEIRPAMANAGVALFVSMVDSKRYCVEYVTGQDKRNTADITQVTLAAVFGCSESGATVTVYWRGEGQDSVDKGLYKAMTGAMKYGLMKTFLVSTGDDPEAVSETDKQQTVPVASEKQRNYIASLWEQAGRDPATLEPTLKQRFAGHGLDDLTAGEASKVIEGLKGGSGERPQSASAGSTATATATRPANNNSKLSDGQLAAIYAVGKANGLDRNSNIAQCEGTYGCKPEQLTVVQAKEYISFLKDEA